MKITTTEVVPQTTREVLIGYRCEFCKAVFKREGYEFAEVTLQFAHGSRYPEGGVQHSEIFDCCAECWGDKVAPALRALGGKSRDETVEY